MNFSKSSTLVIVDSTVDHYETLIQGIQPGAEVVVLDATQDGIEQLTQAIADYTHLNSLHVVSHGRSGEIHLGAIALNAQTLKQYTQQIKSWAKALATNAEILIYGCEVAAGTAGRALVRQISQLTGANVAASTTLTGSSAQGGNWQLEQVMSSTSGTASSRRSPLAFQSQTLATYPGVLAVLLSETFREADVTEKPWQFGIGTGTVSANPFLTARATVAPSQSGLPGAGTAIDTPGNGALRLTGVANNQATFAIYDRPLSQADGLTITFDSYAYGGTPFAGSNGDGISFFLVDASTNAAPITTAGAFGGSLGYAQKQVQGIPGIVGGYLGVGYDEFGNYSTSLEDANLQRPTPAGVATPVRDSIAVRGSAASQYAFLGGTTSLDIGVDNPTATTRDAAQRRTRIDLSPTGILTVRVDLNSDNDFADQGEVVINNLNLTPINGALPSSFKLGFAGSTGTATNIHEVRNLVVRDFVPPDIIIPPPQVVDPKPPGPLDDGCLPGRNIKGNFTTNQIRGTRNSDTLIGFAGNDLLQGRGCNDRLDGGLGDDRMFGNGGRDTLNGQQGNDRGLGGRGTDRLLGGLGNDILDGGDDRDVLEGGRGKDRLKGGKGFDTLDGGRNDDRLDGNIGNDTLRGRQDSDILRGNGGNDTLSGGLGRDRLGGNRQQDVLLGNRGNDALFGGRGGDTLDGGQGNDRLDGGTQADRLIGGLGNDRLIGSGGADVMTGGEGSDRFIYKSSQKGVDVITDFQVSRRSAIDLIDLSRIFSRVGYSSTDRFRKYVRLTAVGANTRVRVDFNGNTAGGFQSLVTLNAVSNLTANAFLVS